MSRAMGVTLITCLSIVGSALVLVSLACCYYCYVRHKSRKDDHSPSLKDYSWNVKSFHFGDHLRFTTDDVINAIKKENMIGKGGSGEVYRVSLENGDDVAVKHIQKTHSLEFAAEEEMLSSIRHDNVVKLYCSITSEDSNLLVYEYLPNGSLWDRLHSSGVSGLDWNTRYEIAVGAAKGLECLHHGCERPVIHRDVKSSNILLDEHLKPRLAGFGLAKVVQTDTDTTGGSIHVRLVGTHGYVAPEYAYTCRVNEKSDVYSFGVVLMELVTGKKPLKDEFGGENHIVNWVRSKMGTKESLSNLVDSRMDESYKEEAAIVVLPIAFLCTSSSPNDRPTMRQVVQALENRDCWKSKLDIFTQTSRFINGNTRTV